MKRVLLAGVGLFALAVAAQPVAAADVPMARPIHKAPVAAPVFDWTGWYGGVNAGVGVSQTHASSELREGSIDRGGASFAGGVQAGYNWQFHRSWVAGIEADIGYLGIDRSFRDWNNSSSFGVKTDWYGTIRGRLGYTNGPSLFYVTGGAAFVKVNNNHEGVLAGNTTGSKTETAAGWTAGAGIETMLGGNWSAKAEYLYVDAGRQDVLRPDPGGDLVHFDNRFHVFRKALNYRFGGGKAPVPPLPAHNWSGFYAGVYAGGGLSQVHADTTGPLVRFGEIDIAGDGFTGGVQAGYNWQFHRNWVAGVEADFGWLGIDRTFENWFANETFGVETNWYGTARGRLGYSTGPALLYVTGGAAFVRVKNNFHTPSGGGVHASESETASGWTAGGGIEAVLARNWTAKIEYLYIDAGTQDVFNPEAHDGRTAHFDNRFHVVRLGLNYQFATGKAPVVTRY